MSELLKDKSYNDQGPDWSILSNLARMPSPNYGRFTPENTSRYIEDRFLQNLDMLEREVKDESLIELYKNISDEYPILRTVALRNEDICDNAYFSSASIEPGDTSYMPIVACNLSHSETYAFGVGENIEESLSPMDDRLGTAYFIKRLAFAVGADWKKCAKNIRLNADATLLHEFGHAHDFLENYLRPEYEKINGNSRGAEALYHACETSRENRAEFERRGPNPEGQWLGRNSKEWHRHERRLQAMGIDNYDEYKYAIHQYYRDMPDESYADQFAYCYIVEHYDKYFTVDKDERSERIFVDETREIKLDPDFVHILNLKQGLGVEIDRLDKNRKSVSHIKGFLAFNMYVGKSVYLYENGDPRNPGGKWRIARGISEITLKSVRDNDAGKINRYVFFKDENGVEYHISRTEDEPQLIDASPAEMAAELDLKAGDRVQLIKHLPEKDAREMTKKAVHNNWYPNWTIDGVVENIDRASKDANAIISFQENGIGDQLNLAYPPKRKWKTYYMGNYEILPLPKQPQEEN